MKERPILFSAPMVRALLASTKTQTRRLMKAQPEPPRAIYGIAGADTTITPDLHLCENGMGVAWRFEMSKIADGKGHHLEAHFIDHEPVRSVCPYGAPGDRLWVRETFFAYGRWETRHSTKKGRDEWHFIDMTLECDRRYVYAVEDDAAGLTLAKRRRAGATPEWWKRPAIFMPRAVSRITLEITEVRVERLQDISEADARAEGIVEQRGGGWGLPAGEHFHLCDPRISYWSLWEAINGRGSVEASPWTWAVTFRELEPTHSRSPQ